MKHQLIVTWQHIRRSPYQALGAIMIMTFTIYIALFFGLITLAGHTILSYLESRPPVIAFFTDEVTSESQVTDTISELKATGKNPKINFVSKEEALEIYRERNKDDKLLLELVTANILPSSLEVSATNLSDLPAFYAILKKAPNVEEISYQQDVVKSLTLVVDRIRREGLLLVGFLTITSLLTLLTIIGMKIALRKDEIEIQRLIGASKWYIRAPFLFEGFFYGTIGALIAWSVIYARIFFETPNLVPYVRGMNILPVSPILMLEILGVSILVGGLIGVLGSFLAVWRYLKN